MDEQCYIRVWWHYKLLFSPRPCTQLPKNSVQLHSYHSGSFIWHTASTATQLVAYSKAMLSRLDSSVRSEYRVYHTFKVIQRTCSFICIQTLPSHAILFSIIHFENGFVTLQEPIPGQHALFMHNLLFASAETFLIGSFSCCFICIFL